MSHSDPRKTARVHRPHRMQIEMCCLSLDQRLDSEHRARLVWAFVQTLDVSPFYSDIKVTRHTTGNTAIAPELLLALWFLATLDGIGSARELARRCETDLPYLWMLGEVTVNHHTLSDFRVGHGERLERLLIDGIAALVAGNVVSLDTIAQDGMRVRANAGRGSFRRLPTLEKLQELSREHVERLKQEAASGPAPDARRQAAAARAAREFQERVDEAVRQHKTLSTQREKRKKGDGATTRVSTTDPEARTMKMANGGFDPAYNVQFATDAKTRMIVGVDVTNEGTDGGEMPPMLEKIEIDYGKRPGTILVDSAYATKESVTETQQGGTVVVSTVPRSEQLRKHGKDPHAPQKNDTAEYIEFRARMGDPEWQELYKTRPSIAEFANANCRNRNLRQFGVRGLVKAKAVALWHALTFNLLRMLDLRVAGA